GRNAARDHGAGHDLAFRQIRSRRRAAAHDRPAKKTFTPQPAGFIDAHLDVLARAEHEQQVGRPKRRRDQMMRIDRGNLGLCRRSPVWDCHGSSRFISNAAQRAVPCGVLRNHISCRLIAKSDYGSNVSGSASNEYPRGRLRLMNPPMVQANQIAMPTRNNAPVNSEVASARTRSPTMAIASNASIATAMA